MLVLFFFEPYARNECLKEVKDFLKKEQISFEVLHDWGLRALVKSDDLSQEILYKLISNITCISKVIMVTHVIEQRDVEAILEAVLETVSHHFEGDEIRIEVRRWDKSYPITSIELGRIVAREILSKGIAKPNPHVRDKVVFIGIERDKVIIGYSKHSLVLMKPGIPSDIVNKIVAIVDRIQTVYEIMDLIQFARTIGFELRFFRPNINALNQALKNLGLEKPHNIKTCSDLDELFRDVELVIILTPYGKRNERDLISLLCSRSESRRIAFVLGNEYEDVSPELRSRATIEIRLGPRSEMSMRTTTALAYALGIALTTLAGYIPCDEIVASDQ